MCENRPFLSWVFVLVAGVSSTLLNATEPPDVEGSGSSLLSELDPMSHLLDDVRASRQVLAGKIQAEVEQGLDMARKQMGTDAQAVVQALKVILDNVDRVRSLILKSGRSFATDSSPRCVKPAAAKWNSMNCDGNRRRTGRSLMKLGGLRRSSLTGNNASSSS